MKTGLDPLEYGFPVGWKTKGKPGGSSRVFHFERRTLSGISRVGAPNQSQLLELTSVRAFAALIVVLFHMYQEGTTSQSGLLRRLTLDGHLGVDFFFILSGFILTHVYLSRWRAGTFKYRQFLWARFARVYPLHFFMILLFLLAYLAAIIVGMKDLEGMRWGHLPWHVLLLHSWGFTDSHSWNFPSWSVSAEAFAYLAFPVCLFLLPLGRPKLAVAISTIAIAAAWIVMREFDWTLTKLMYDFGIVRIAFEFVLGVSIYLVYEKTSLRAELSSILAGICSVIVLVVAATQASEIISIFLFAAIIFFLADRARSDKGSILRSRFLVYLGEISYSTYMVHLLVLMVFRQVFAKVSPGLEFGGPLGAIVTLAVIYLGSVLLYHFIEVPSRSFLREVSKKRAARAASSVN